VSIEFRILGPLEVLVGGEPVALGGPRQRALLAMLLAQANEAVPAQRLVDGVWDDSPPETAINLVQGYVSQLRKALGRETIATRGNGYSLSVAADDLDLSRFERLAQEATAARSAGDPAACSERLEEALELWRGPALSDLADIPVVRPIAARLDELRLAAIERRVEADLDCGRATEAAAELEVLTAEHPLRERLRALRMLALYRAGRQAEALEAYRDARRVLVEELGIEPGEDLQALESAILRQDPSLAAQPPGGSEPDSAGMPRRTVLSAALATSALPGLADLGAALARGTGHELVLVATVSSSDQLAEVSQRLRELSDSLTADDVVVRVGVFTSVAPGTDVSRLAAEHDVDLVLVDAPDGLLEDPRVLALLEDAPCDVAVVVGGKPAGAGPVLVPFSGFEHDWAAVELGAWLASSLDRPLRLAGPSTGPSGRDASRMLASASLALQRALGVHADPAIVDPSPEALVAEAAGSGVVVVGLTERWRREGLGRTRTALATAAGVTTILVRRGLRPGGLAPRSGDTRFTWTIAAGR
jgi:DNA-binding SARP family transcriptional activator